MGRPDWDIVSRGATAIDPTSSRRTSMSYEWDAAPPTLTHRRRVPGALRWPDGLDRCAPTPGGSARTVVGAGRRLTPLTREGTARPGAAFADRPHRPLVPRSPTAHLCGRPGPTGSAARCPPGLAATRRRGPAQDVDAWMPAATAVDQQPSLPEPPTFDGPRRSSQMTTARSPQWLRAHGPSSASADSPMYPTDETTPSWR